MVALMCLSVAAVTNAQLELGDRLSLTFGRFTAMPTTAALAEKKGWQRLNSTASCNPDLGGYVYVLGESESKKNPQFLTFTENGVLGGWGVFLYGPAAAPLADAGFWSERYGMWQHLAVRTRDAKVVCDANLAVDSLPLLGDRMVLLNNEKQGFEIPVNRDRAEQLDWVRGNCISGMGTHYAYDIKSPGNSTWESSTLLPILPMYRPLTGQITAILINTPQRQTTFLTGGRWEGSFPNSVFCSNWCSDSGCHWNGATGWNTLHWLFEARSENTCEGSICELGRN